MLFTRFFTLAAVTLLLLAACGKDETGPDGGAPSANALLQFAPSDTPYLSANLQPVPEAVIDRFLQRAEPVLATLQDELVETRARLEVAADSTDIASQLALALLQELDGKLNRAGLESLGFDLQAPRALYGLGVFPVFRMGLADAEALGATVQRVLDHAGLPAPQLEHQGQAYWRLTLDESDAGGPQVALYIAVLDDHLAVGAIPAVAEGEMLPHLLGQQSLAPSIAVSRLQAINKRFGFTPYGTGELDLTRLADELMNAESSTGRALAASGIDWPARASEQCRAEIRQIISRAPRAYSGLTELTPDVIGYRLVFETDLALAGELAALVAPVPAADALTARALEFALGLKVGAVRDFLREKSAAIAAAPYQCEHLAGLNEAVRQAHTRLNQPVPPLVNNFQGLRVSLSKVGGSSTAPEGFEGVVAVHVEQPEMFVGMAQMFLPDLAALQLVKGGPPVRLPDTLVPLPEAVAFAALSENAIGFSLGAAEENRLLPFLQLDAGPAGAFLSLNYDTALYLDYTEGLAATVANRDAEPDPAHGAARDIARAARDAYKAIAGRTDIRLRFTPDGFIVDSRLTFK
jgi:hypothetical protein